jgi:hypothetical protein
VLVWWLLLLLLGMSVRTHGRERDILLDDIHLEAVYDLDNTAAGLAAGLAAAGRPVAVDSKAVGIVAG